MRNFLRLSGADRRLLIKATILVALVRLGLSVLSYRTLRRIIPKVITPPANLRNIRRASENRIIWAVTTASRFVPKATCLTQAIAAQIILVRQGQTSRLHIGVAKNEAGKFEAHAWVESQGRVIIGGAEAQRYTPIAAFDAV